MQRPAGDSREIGGRLCADGENHTRRLERRVILAVAGDAPVAGLGF